MSAEPKPEPGRSTSAQPEAATGHVPLRQLLAYALLELPVMGALNLMTLFLGFRYAELGVRLADVAWIVLIARLLDVLIDPAVGFLSDRTRNRLGRRKSWVLAGTPVYLFATWRLFVPPAQVDATYFATWMVTFWLGFSMINIPYYAWGAELSHDYHERTRITTWRTFAGSGGFWLAVVVATACQQLFGFGGKPGEALGLVARYTAVLLPLAVCAMALLVPDRGNPVAAAPVLRGLGVMLRNGPFLRLLAAFTIVGLGPALQGVMYPFFVKHVVGSETSTVSNLIAYLPLVMAGVVLWGTLSRFLEKHQAWMCGMTFMVFATSLYMLVGKGDTGLMLGVLMTSGLGSGALTALPASMKADVVDLDAMESGEDRAGLFFAAWSLAVKLITALGQFIALGSLALIGFQTEGVNTPEQLLGLRVFYSAGPVLLYTTGLLLVWNYPITSRRHAQLRAALAGRGLR
jgi:GPH family glycoside/pentoside/hexuronide:cation symporter